MWLLNKLTPDDKTICNFRANNAKALKEVFRDFTKFCSKLSLFGRRTVSVDGTKIKADNSRNQYYTYSETEKKLEKIDNQITKFFSDLEMNDQVEANEEELDKESAAKILETLYTQKDKLENIIKIINDNGGNPVCAIDKDAALMKYSGGKGYDVCYNLQAAVDEEYGLVSDFNVTNSCNDFGELSDMAGRAKEILEVEELNVLGDTGYSNGKEINACESMGVTCYIPKPEPSHQPEDKNYHRANFEYDRENNCYICPEGMVMPYVRTRERDNYQVYGNRTACMNCPVKSKCTKSQTLREIERNPYQDDVDRADANAKKNPELYRRRKELSEHPFGVIKKKWHYDHYLCRGKDKVIGETSLMLLVFNLRRALNIVGVKEMLLALA
jgi:hypothetical protein